MILSYNEECEIELKRYLESREAISPKLFNLSRYVYRKIWKKGSKKTRIKITPQIL